MRKKERCWGEKSFYFLRKKFLGKLRAWGTELLAGITPKNDGEKIAQIF